MISINKEYDGNWTVFNKKNSKCASIVKIIERGVLSAPNRYRVDCNGITVASMIDHFQAAKSIAYRQVKM